MSTEVTNAQTFVNLVDGLTYSVPIEILPPSTIRDLVQFRNMDAAQTLLVQKGEAPGLVTDFWRIGPGEVDFWEKRLQPGMVGKRWWVSSTGGQLSFQLFTD